MAFRGVRGFNEENRSVEAMLEAHATQHEYKDLLSSYSTHLRASTLPGGAVAIMEILEGAARRRGPPTLRRASALTPRRRRLPTGPVGTKPATPAAQAAATATLVAVRTMLWYSNEAKLASAMTFTCDLEGGSQLWTGVRGPGQGGQEYNCNSLVLKLCK